MKKLIAFLVAFCFIISPSFAQKNVKFGDIDQVKWAKDYIQKAANMGIVKGYDDGNFKPKKDITKCNSLLMVYRMLDYKELIDKAEESELVEKYDNIMDKNDLPEYTGLRETIAYFLENDVITESEIETFISTTSDNKKIQNKISRQEISYYLGRCLNIQLKGNLDADIETDLSDFKDQKKISSKYKSYISLLHQKGIISGDNNKNFNPNYAITRAEFSKLISETINVLEQAEKDSKKSARAEIKKINLDERTINFHYINKDINKEKDISQDVKIYIENEKASFDELKTGMYADVIYLKDKKTGNYAISEIRADKIDEELKSLGKIVKTDNSKKALYYDDEHSTLQDKKLTVDSDIKIFLDKKEVSFSEIRKNQHLSAKYKNDKLYSLILTSKNKYYRGTIYQIDESDDTITLTTEKTKLKFDIPSTCKIRKNGEPEHLSKLKVGNEAKISTEYGKVVKLETEPHSKFGIINGIFNAGSGGKEDDSIEILFDDKETKTYSVDSDVKIKINGKLANTMFDLKVNNNVNLTFDGDQLIEIDARSYGNKIGLIAYVKDVDRDDKRITVETIQNLQKNSDFIYELLLEDAIILNKNGSKARVKDIKEWQKVFFYGYRDRDEYDENTIKVEKLTILEDESYQD